MSYGTHNLYLTSEPPSQRSRVTLAQAELVAEAIRAFCGVLPRAFGVSPLAQIDLAAFAPVFGLVEYERLLRALHAGGFVLRDAPADFPLELANQQPGRHLGACGLPRLRRYLHTLVLAERRADGDHSTVLAAAKSGALGLVAARLGADASLRGPSSFTHDMGGEQSWDPADAGAGPAPVSRPAR